MLTIARSTLRARWVSFAGAFVTLALGTALMSMMLLTLVATHSTPFPGPQRYAAEPTVVVPESPDGSVLPPPAALSVRPLSRLAALGSATPDRTFSAQLASGPSGEVGHAWSSAAFTPYHLKAGHAPAAANEIVVGGGAASLVGRRVIVTTDGGSAAYRVSGVTNAVWFENALFFTDAAAAKISPPVNAVVLDASGPTVQAAAGRSALVLTGDARSQADPDPTGGSAELENVQGLAGTTVVIVACVAVFIVIATFAFVVDQRRRELALLRLVGATPRQVRRIVLAESLLIGIAASLVGSVLGPFGAGALDRWIINAGIAPSWFVIGLTWYPLVGGFLIGVLAALTGAATVSLRAARVRPIEALQDAAADRRVMTVLRSLLGVGLLVGAVITAVVIGRSMAWYAGNPRKYAGVPLQFVGAFALLAPVILYPVIWLATWPLARFGAGSLLVRQNMLTAKRRTAATVAPVVVAVGLVAALLCIQSASIDAAVAAAREQTHAGYVVVPEGADQIDRDVSASIGAVPGTRLTPVTPVSVSIGTPAGQVFDTLDTESVPPAAMGGVVAPTVIAGSLNHLGNNFLVIDQRTAKEDGIGPGALVRTWLPDGTSVLLRVAAVVRNGLSGTIAYLSAAHTAHLLPSQVYVRAGAGTPAVGAVLAAALRGQAASAVPMGVVLGELGQQAAQKNRSEKKLILGITVGYALIAVANTLIMATAGRRRELAALALAGATRRQITGVIAAESASVVLIGTILSAAAAAAAVVAQRLTLLGLVNALPVDIPWVQICEVAAVCTAAAVGVSVASAWWVIKRSPVEVAGIRE